MTTILHIERDLKRLERLAQDGQIRPDAPMPLACIFDAMRNAQTLLGPEYLALAALLDPVPVAHIKNYLKNRKDRGWLFTGAYKQSDPSD